MDNLHCRIARQSTEMAWEDIGQDDPTYIIHEEGIRISFEAPSGVYSDRVVLNWIENLLAENKVSWLTRLRPRERWSFDPAAFRDFFAAEPAICRLADWI